MVLAEIVICPIYSMKPQSTDTSLKAEKTLITGIRNMTSAEKFRRIEGMVAMMNTLARADILRRYPKATEEEIRLRIAARRIPAALMKKAFDWDPEVEGF
jgi:hypothetical protein